MPDRELGGYATSIAAAQGGGVSLREIAIIISPAAGTTLSVVEQTFTVPGVLATDRLAYLTQTTGAMTATGTSAVCLALMGRVSAISVVSIPFYNPGTALTPTTSITYVFGIASARVIP